jgi:hypothetical protein
MAFAPVDRLLNKWRRPAPAQEGDRRKGVDGTIGLPRRSP